MTAHNHRNNSRRIDACADCGQALPLCQSLDPSEARTWLCGRCGVEHKGQLAPDYTVALLRNVRPEPVMFDRTQIAPPSRQLLETARLLRSSADCGFRDKRQAFRFQVSVPVPTQACDEMLRPTESPMMLVARNISTGGICLLGDRAVRANFMVLELTGPGGDPYQILVQVMRSRPRNSVHEIGGEFVARMAAATSHMLR